MGRLLIQFAGTNTTKALSETLPKNTIIVDEDLHQLRLHDGTTQGGHVIGGSGSGSGGGVPVGAIFTTPRTGTIEGAVEANGSEYNIADYSGEGSIGALLTAGSIAYVSKTEFQTQVTNTGACDSFGWNGAGSEFYCWKISEPDGTGYTTSANPVVGDTVYYISKNYTTIVAGYVTEVGSNETGSYIMWTDSATVHYRTPSNDKTKAPDPTFLVPKLNPWHIGKSAPVVGTGVALGLTPYGFSGAGSAAEPKMSASAGFALEGSTGSYRQGVGISQNKNESGMIADLSETTNLRVMVQLATGATDQALETCTSVLSDVSALKDHRVIEFQAPTAANNYTWYRKYADGWVEQGGRYTNRQNILTTMPVAMSDTNYSVVLTYETDSAYNPQYAALSISTNKTTTSFTIKNAGNIYGGWQVSGMSAQ